MRMYIMTDLEGVAGITQGENRDDTGHWNAMRRQRMSRLLTGEVNAATEGLLAGGFDEIIINDGHGAGSTFGLRDARPAPALLPRA